MPWERWMQHSTWPVWVYDNQQEEEPAGEQPAGDVSEVWGDEGGEWGGGE